MTTIITRAGKGSPLTNNEMDQNLINLNNDKLEVSVANSTFAPLASPAFTGVPTAPNPPAATNDTQIATTNFVQSNFVNISGDTLTGQLNGITPTDAANLTRKDYVDAADALKAPLASPAFTGNPTAPTPATADNDTSIATTAHVQANAALKVSKAGDTMTGALRLNSIYNTSDLESVAINGNTAYESGSAIVLRGSGYSANISAIEFQLNNLIVGQTQGGDWMFGSNADRAGGLVNVRKDDNGASSPAIMVMNSGGSAGFISFSSTLSIIGSITANAGQTSYNTTSDYRLKKDVVDIENGLNQVNLLRPVRFKWLDGDTVLDGFIAHEVQEVIPTAVSGEKDAVSADGKAEYQGLDSGKLIPMLVAAVQELSAKLDSALAEIAELKAAK